MFFVWVHFLAEKSGKIFSPNIAEQAALAETNNVHSTLLESSWAPGFGHPILYILHRRMTFQKFFGQTHLGRL